MKALELMIACREHGREKERLEERLSEMEEAMTSLAVSQDAAVQSGSGDRYAAYAARRDEIERRKKALGRLLAAEGPAVILLTDDLPAIQRRSLRDFYVHCDSVSHIAQASGYTVSNIYKALHAGREAVRAIPEEAVDDELPGWYGKKEEDAEWNC